MVRACEWCGGEIPPAARVDSICCSKRCRQARHRFRAAVGQASRSAGAPLRLAYADPPYPGRSRRYYGDHPDYAGEVDHAELIASLVATYDGWALSTSADALVDVLALCPPGVKVAAWHRGARPRRRVVRPLNAWEPVIYFGERVGQDLDDASRLPSDPTRRGDQVIDASRSTVVRHDASRSAVGDASAGSPRRVDSLVYAARARTTDPGRVVGAKPATFCRWIFDLLGAQAGDEFVDVFPGSGGVARAWLAYVEGVDA